MPYCSINDLRRILPEKVTIGDSNIGTPSPGRTGIQRSNISDDQARFFIEYSTQYIDARLRNMYSCPLRRTKAYETELTAIASQGHDVDVTVRDSTSFNYGQYVRLQDRSGYEEAQITELVDFTKFKVSFLSRSYHPDYGIVSILEYPDPIPTISARMACSYILDKLYTAEQSPDVSYYGRTQRNLARDAIDDILAGEVLLFGQEHTGRRFIRGSLIDAYRSPADVQRGQEKE